MPPEGKDVVQGTARTTQGCTGQNTNIMNPAIVKNNDWRRIVIPDAFTPTEKVSVIVPYYNAPDELVVVLEALKRQTYPKELTEIIVSADYPDPTLPFEGINSIPGIRVLRQKHDGFGAGRARNAGALAATGKILVFFDGDIVPAPGCVTAHARWHSQASNLVTVGDRDFVARDAISPESVPRVLEDLLDGTSGLWVQPSHHKNLIDLTDEFTRGGDLVYQAVIGHNFGVRRDSYLKIGGNRADSRHWGLEDTEFGYRAYQRGLIIVFAKDARTWHLGEQDYQYNTDKMFGRRMQSALMEHYIADYRFRNASPGRSFTVPEHVVSVSCPDPAMTMEVVLDILADPPHDLVVRVESDDDVVRHRLGGDPRVAFGPVDHSLNDYPDSPLHIEVRTDRAPKRGLINRLRRLMGAHAAVRAPGENRQQIGMVRAWALHRAEECGCPLHEVGDVRTVPIGKLVTKRKVKAPRTSASPTHRLKMLIDRIQTLQDAKRTILHRIRDIQAKRLKDDVAGIRHQFEGKCGAHGERAPAIRASGHPIRARGGRERR